MTNKDPIVDEARRAGEAYMKQFNYNLHDAFADMRQRTEAARVAGRKVVSLPPRRIPHPASVGSKKAS
jgi:hypothetical protein